MARVNTRAAAVTGAGGGLGRDIALGVAAKHYRVFGTAMNPRKSSTSNRRLVER